MATLSKRVSRDTGAVTWQARVRIQGERPRTRTFRRKTDAKAWASKIETDLAAGAFVPQGADRRRTLADLIDCYLEYLPEKAHNRDAKRERMRLTWWREHYGYVTLNRLRPALIKEARTELAKRKTRYGKPISGPTMNRYMAALSAACKFGWQTLEWLPSNPVLAVPRSAESDNAGRPLKDDERKRLFEACREHPDHNILPFITLALATGLRYSNLRNLRWEDVDLADGVLVIEHTKNGESRHVPLIGSAHGALREHYDADPTGTGWVWKGQRDDAPAAVERHWRDVRDAAGLQGMRFHDLRHTVGSVLTEHGASLAQVADVLGHKTLVMAKRYSRQHTDAIRSTLDGVAGKLGGSA